MSRCVRGWVALAVSAAPAERGGGTGGRREERSRKWAGASPQKPRRSRLQPSFDCRACAVLLPSINHSASSRHTVTVIVPRLPSVTYSLGSLPSHSKSHATLTCQTMTTISKDAQQSSYPYVMDNRSTTLSTDDKHHFIAR
jgi:hypothetical protein